MIDRFPPNQTAMMPIEEREGYHSPELGEKILELGKLLNDKLADSPKVTRATIVQSLYNMSPGCFFDDMENEDEAKGAIKTLDWIIMELKHVRV